MEPPEGEILYPVPIRLGAFLKLIRTKLNNLSIAKTVAYEFKTDRPQNKAVKDMSIATWSSYELGTRVPTNETITKLIDIIIAFYYELFQDVQERGLCDYLHFLYNEEQFLSALRNIIPIRHIGSCILRDFFANFCSDTFKEHLCIEEDADLAKLNSISNEDQNFSKLLDSWNSFMFADNFRTYFAAWLTKDNSFIDKSFISKKTSIMETELLSNKKKFSQYICYGNPRNFLRGANKTDLLFEYPGPAMDAIMALTSGITFDQTTMMLDFLVSPFPQHDNTVNPIPRHDNNVIDFSVNPFPRHYNNLLYVQHVEDDIVHLQWPFFNKPT